MEPEHPHLQNKVCLIAGASGAIGVAVAKQFAQEGARLALTYKTRPPAEHGGALSAAKGRIAWYPLDVADWPQVADIVARVKADFGGIDVLVNCTGVIGPIGPLESTDPVKWARTIEINLTGSMYLARAVVPLMKEQGRGKIVLFSGGGAAYGRPCFTAYSSSKAGLVRFTESLAQEVEPANIQVNAVAPGPVDSRMWEEMRAAGDAGGPKLIEELKRMEETGGASPDRAARLTVSLASSPSNRITGRLLSAVWDDWEHLDKHSDKIASSDAWTLRRVPLG